jgi:hypothetical protein
MSWKTQFNDSGIAVRLREKKNVDVFYWRRNLKLWKSDQIVNTQKNKRIALLKMPKRDVANLDK